MEDGLSFSVEVFDPEDWARSAADRIVAGLPDSGAMVITGGTTAERLYPVLARHESPNWSGLEILFSDERCVPPDHPDSNFKMATELLLRPLGIDKVHRMPGELPPEAGARTYHDEIGAVVRAGIGLTLLGLGADAHVGANFPHSHSLSATDKLCVAVHRPDGLDGLTLTPPAIAAGAKILILATGPTKAEAVRRVVTGDEPIDQCPARMLTDHPDVTLLLDSDAAAHIS